MATRRYGISSPRGAHPHSAEERPRAECGRHWTNRRRLDIATTLTRTPTQLTASHRNGTWLALALPELSAVDTWGLCTQATLDMYLFMFESPDAAFRSHAQRSVLAMLRPMPPCAFLGSLGAEQRDAVDAFGRLLLRRVEAACDVRRCNSCES